MKKRPPAPASSTKAPAVSIAAEGRSPATDSTVAGARASDRTASNLAAASVPAASVPAASVVAASVQPASAVLPKTDPPASASAWQPRTGSRVLLAIGMLWYAAMLAFLVSRVVAG